MVFNSDNKIRARTLGSRQVAQEKGWYVAETLPREELRATENIEKQGFDVFLPRFRRVRRHARKQDVLLAPVFPGYLFIKMDIRDSGWTKINSTRGVRRLLGFGSRHPQAVDQGVMEFLMGRCEGGIMQRLHEQLAPGDRVVMNTGPLADFVATIESLDSKGRVNILLQILGGDRSLTVPHSSIRPAST